MQGSLVTTLHGRDLNSVFRLFSYDAGNVTIYFGPTNGAAAFAWGDTIVVNADDWLRRDSVGRLGLLAHEITHSVQFRRLGNDSLLNFSATRFLWRYLDEIDREDNYRVPESLAATPIEKVDPVSTLFTLDQLAERVAAEVLRRYQ